MSLEIIEEVNYFFKFSVFQEKLLALYERNPEFVVPKKRFNEIRAFVERGPEDFSISRRKEKMPWGVPVPGDDEHVMYVWFDALTNYISTLGWPNDEENFEKFWGTKKNPSAIQVAGKDNLRQQAAMWQAMLMAADLPTSKQIFINGFISVDGQKMSKSLGNVIRPQEMVEKFGVDGTRYLLLTKSNFGEDSDVSWGRLIEKYNADLANGLGNLVSRVLTLGKDIHKPAINSEIATIEEKVQRCAMKEALDDIWIVVDLANKKIESEKPWELKKNNPERFEEIIKELLVDLNTVARALGPFLPNTSERLINMLEMEEKEILFQRIK